MYGLRQSPRLCCQKFDTYILGLSLWRSKVNHCVYSKQVGGHFIDVVVYIEIGKDKQVIKDVKSHLYSNFDMKYLSVESFILGIEIKRYQANTHTQVESKDTCWDNIAEV